MIARDFYTSLEFSGAESVLTASSLPVVGSFSYSVWAKPLAVAGVSGDQCLMGSRFAAEYPTLLLTDLGTIQLQDNKNAATLAETAIGGRPLKRWAHIAATYDAGTGIARVYVDGVLAASGAAAADRSYGPDTLGMGFWAAGNAYTGMMDEPCMYDRALTPEEVWSIYNDGNYPSRPLMLYRCDEADGIVLRDTEGSAGINGVVNEYQFHADVPCDPPMIDQPYTGCYAPDGSARYIESADLGREMDGLSRLTLAGWFSYGNLGFFFNSQALFALASTNTCLMVFAESSSLISISARSADAVDTRQDVVLSHGTLGRPMGWYGKNWVFISGEVDYGEKSLSIYINGILRSKDVGKAFSRNDLLTTGATRMYVGATTGGTRSIVRAANVAMWGEALGKEEHRRMYLTGNYGRQKDMLLWWKLQEPNGATIAVDSSPKGRNGTVQGVDATNFQFQPLRGPFA